MLVSAKRASLVWNDNQTKHTFGCEIDERSLKNMNLTYFRPKMRGNVKQKQQPSQHQICRQNIRHQKFIWEHHRWCYVKISEVATLVSMIPNFWCSLEVAAAELHLCFVIKGNVYWKRTFLRWLPSLLHHKHMKLFKPIHTTCYCVVRHKRF